VVDSIKSVLMKRDGISAEEADDMIQCAKEELAEHIENGDITSADEICADHFGLEPDYLEELMEDMM